MVSTPSTCWAREGVREVSKCDRVVVRSGGPMQAKELKQLRESLEELGLSLADYLSVSDQRLDSWISGRRIPGRRSAQLAWVSRFVDALNASYREVPSCEHSFEPTHGFMVRHGSGRPDIYDEARSELGLERECERCRERNEAFDRRLQPSDRMPSAMPQWAANGDVLGLVLGTFCAVGLRPPGSLVWLIAGPVLGALIVPILLEIWYQVPPRLFSRKRSARTP